MRSAQPASNAPIHPLKLKEKRELYIGFLVLALTISGCVTAVGLGDLIDAGTVSVLLAIVGSVSTVLTIWLFIHKWRQLSRRPIDLISERKVKTAETQREKKSSSWLVGVVALVIMLSFLWAPGGYTAAWLWPDSTWANGWRYSLDSDLKDATVTVESIPHDCEFLTAPLGSKHCHYDKRVLTVRIRTDSTGRLVSTDEGKTWTKAEPSDHAAVYVSWQRVQE
jgi:hypothetical protein